MGPLLRLLVVLVTVAGFVEAQQPPHKATEEVFRRGGVDAPEPYSFSRTPELVVNGAGQIFARVAQDGAVRVFDADGDFLRRIGRRGMGPGEFTTAQAHGLLGDTLWVVDWPTPRIATFTVRGAQIATVRTPYDFGYSFGGPTGVSGLLAGGRAYARPPGTVRGVEGRIMLPLLVGDAAMRVADTARVFVDTVALLPNPRDHNVS